MISGVKSRIGGEWGRVKTRLLATYARRQGLFLGQVNLQRDWFALVVTMWPPRGSIQPCVALYPDSRISRREIIGEGLQRRHFVDVLELEPRRSFDPPLDEGIVKVYLAAEKLLEELARESTQEPAVPAPVH